ncbi:MAG: Fpg/Nei family DNA glycosylase [Chloroflexi bacterium]|nr:Fpg/Nei family DNA glycosylase [Chloroflexota bacterium]
MPELPEIDALRETIEARLHAVRPMSVWVRQFALVKTFDPPLEAVVGDVFAGARRHGKHLLLDWGADHTVSVHLGIGGRLVFGVAGKNASRSVSLGIDLDDGAAVQIAELGSKKRTSVHVLHRADVAAHLASLGVDALSAGLSVARLGSLLHADRWQLKHFLTDQRRIAGIGNAYSDEILWEARLAPLRLTTSLGDGEVERLHVAIRMVLLRAKDHAREGNYLLMARGDERGAFLVHRRDGQACPRCDARIASIHLADSSLQYCPSCQAEGRAYADRRLSRLLR